VNPLLSWLAVPAALLLGLQASMAAPVHHDLVVKLDPAAHRIVVTDRLDLRQAIDPDGAGRYRFGLHADLAAWVTTPGWRLEPAEGPGPDSERPAMPTVEVPLAHWLLVPEDEPDWPVEIRYHGTLHHPVTQVSGEYQRSFSETPGIIGEDGAYLSRGSFWVPTFDDRLITFRLEASVASPGWDVVSQGERVSREVDDVTITTTWQVASPTEEVYLIAGPWTVYDDRAGDTALFAYLRTPDPALANRYLQATRRYLAMYEGILPAYPYPSFALVENFWETGYGMPGFTLLGPRIIRFPWILTSSYPHEILHNWWGNSVYIDPSRGNWSEGLTAYMADHVFAEQRGEAAVYRRSTLKKFTDFVAGGDDVPLTAFHSRSSPATEAVGYGKALMLFHMARRAMGDAAFLAGLSEFAETFRFRRATFDDLAASLEKADGGDWTSFFEAWITRKGAPRLEIVRADVSAATDAALPWEVTVELRQAQAAEPYPLTVPVVVTVEGRDEPVSADLRTEGRSGRVVIPCPDRPLRVDVDPAFEVMRRLDPLEVPPALSTLFADDDPLFVLPARATAEERSAWEALAADWKGEGEPRTVLDTDLDVLPVESAWLLGWDNRFRAALVEGLADQGVSWNESEVTVAEETIPRDDHSIVLVGRHAVNPELAIGWVAARPIAAVPGLARKLPHYTRYSYLGFRGDEPENMAKGLWKPLASPLVRALADGPPPDLAVAARTPLVDLPPAFDAEALGRTVAFLAADEQEGRGLGSEGLERATAWVEQRFRGAGLAPAGAEGFRESWSWTGGEPRRELSLVNLVGAIHGSDDELSDEPVLVMAHLDHLGEGWPDVRGENRGKVHPGADDNASGVAVLLEIARAMAAEPARPRPVIFAVVTGEEAGRLGSKHRLEAMAPDALPFACVNLDTIGRLADDKLLVINADSAREWRFIFMGVQYTSGVAATIVSEPLDSSDQVSCLEHGVPAVQLFTGPHADYHRPGDRAGKLDLDGMAQLSEVVHLVTAYLAERTDPLTITIPGRESSAKPAAPAGGGSRRVSLGTMPDFAFPGPGVRIQQVLPGSAAEAAGLAAEDVLVAIDGEEVKDLKTYSEILKRHEPGDEVELTVERGRERVTVRAVLRAR
jgi:hypothetical protein